MSWWSPDTDQIPPAQVGEVWIWCLLRSGKPRSVLDPAVGPTPSCCLCVCGFVSEFLFLCRFDTGGLSSVFSFQGCCNKLSQMGRLKQKKFTLSQLWRAEV